MKFILEKILKILARAYLAIHQPTIIAVTGNVGKTSTKMAIGAVLSRKYKVRTAGGNLNNELGVPLAILGDYADRYYEKGSTAGFWFSVIGRGLTGLVWPGRYPKILVLEYGADRPGDIERLTKTFQPDIAVITPIGAVPVHVEFFENPAALVEEKAKLVKTLAANDQAVLCADDLAVAGMKEKTEAKVLTYGFNPEANISASDLVISLTDDGYPSGISFKLNYRGGLMPVRIAGWLGQSQAMAAAAAAAVAISLGMNLVEIGQGLENYQGEPGRLRLLSGIRESLIVDDSYNSSPEAVKLALETIKHLPSRRKIAILGDMLELGEYTLEAHQKVGRLVANAAQVLVCVGDKARFIADAALGGIAKENIYIFNTAEEAKIKVKELIETGDLTLVKGSQGMRLERIVEEIMAEPENKKELLARQSQKWLNKP